MLNPTETGMLLAKASDFDGRTLTQTMVDSWCEGLEKYVTIADAKQAVIDFYSDPQQVETGGRRLILPLDVNARVLKMRQKRTPEENKLQEMLAPFELGDEGWNARNLLLTKLADGMSEQQAIHEAVEEARTEQITAAPEKPKPATAHHFIGNFSKTNINDVLTR